MPDANILIYAHRKDEPSHSFYRKWMESLVNSGVPFGLSALTAVEVFHRLRAADGSCRESATGI